MFVESRTLQPYSEDLSYRFDQRGNSVCQRFWTKMRDGVFLRLDLIEVSTIV